MTTYRVKVDVDTEADRFAVWKDGMGWVEVEAASLFGEARGAEAELLALRPVVEAAVAWHSGDGSFQQRSALHQAVADYERRLSGRTASPSGPPDGWVPDVFLEAPEPPEDSDGDSPPKLGVAEYVGTATTVDGREFVGDPPGFDPHSEGL